MTPSVQASGVFCLDLLTLALSFGAIPTHMPNFTAQVTLPTKPLSSSSSSSRSTQFHGRIPTISTCTTVIITAVLWASRRVLQGSLPRAGKPHSAISAVSQRHGMTNIAWVTQHDMLLHILVLTHASMPAANHGCSLCCVLPS